MPRLRRIPVHTLVRNPWSAVLLVVLLLVVVALRGWPDAETYQVLRVIDGDTLVLADGERVRLIGADTPETVKPNHPVEPWGPQATEFTREFVSGGEVRLEFDGPRKDKYGRLLAHVWVADRQLGEELIRAGLARAQTKYSYSAEKKQRFVSAQAEARSAGRGIWSR